MQERSKKKEKRENQGTGREDRDLEDRRRQNDRC
jgi:hypothetical protein